MILTLFLTLQVPPSEAGSRIAELEGKRKQLTSGGNLKEKHNNWGSVLLGLGVTFSVLGPVNTYLRTGRVLLKIQSSCAV